MFGPVGARFALGLHRSPFYFEQRGRCLGLAEGQFGRRRGRGRHHRGRPARRPRGRPLRLDLGQRRDIQTISTWSFQQNGIRGPQHFSLYGSTSETNPGWNTSDRKLFTPLIEVDSTHIAAEPFQATSIRSSTNQPLGQFRWLVWHVYSITPLGENTSFQEVQVIAP